MFLCVFEILLSTCFFPSLNSFSLKGEKNKLHLYCPLEQSFKHLKRWLASSQIDILKAKGKNQSIAKSILVVNKERIQILNLTHF